MKYEFFNEDGTSQVSYPGTLEENKQEALGFILQWFEEQFKTGSFVSSLGFRVDNRRYGDKNDRDNVSGLLKLGITTFRDSDGNFHNLTTEQLTLLEQEMIQDGLMKYQMKWQHEAMIAIKETPEEVWEYIQNLCNSVQH